MRKRGHAEITCLLESRNKELISWYKSEFNFEDNFTCFSWPLDFIPSTVIQDEQRRNQIISVTQKASLWLASDYSNWDQDCTRGNNVANTAIAVFNTNIQP